uniref:KN motif and ankyrin repeat domain-containing protein 2 n=1 Tax=Tetraodon nigroviridis TaxID=99883 RepID=H3DMK1_TETNG
MAQVLHMDPGFPGKLNPPAPPSLHGKEQEAPYSVETPYGYRLDLDFLKYVNDIEKGNTIKKVAVQRRPRYGSLPRGYGYAGSWWTSTESLCSNASMDSRHSSYSYCAPGYHTAQRPSFTTARVEKTLLDARRKLEEEKEGRRYSNLGSMNSSVAGSNTSLSSAHSFNRAHGGSGSFTPINSGLSTPVTPTPAHLQHVREQMATALRKIRELEEQVKTIPVLQVKISVLQEEKRQLSVQLKSQKFLGHTLGFSRGRSRGELYIDIPEEEPDTTGPSRTRGVGVGVREEDLGLLPETEVLKSQVGQLEGQLRRTMQELQAAQQQVTAVQKGPRAEHPVMATSTGWQEPHGCSLHTLVSFTQVPQQREQRTVGIQVYTLEQPTVVGVGTPLRAEICSPPAATEGHRGGQAQGPVTRCVCCIPKRRTHNRTHRRRPSTRRMEPPQAFPPRFRSELDPCPSSPASSPPPSLRSIMKRKAEGEPGSPSTKKNLQFIGVNGGYESTSSDDSSSQSSDEGSDSSEYHEPPATDCPPAAGGAPNPASTAAADVAKEQSETTIRAEQKPAAESSDAPAKPVRVELSDSLVSALHVLQKALGEPNAFVHQAARAAYTAVLQEWRVSCHKAADTAVVQAHMSAFASISPQLLEFVINMADGNGNTALHYTVSHSNFPVVKLLLDTGLCNADKQNKAGYTAIMLTALAAFHSDSDFQTVLQTVRTGDVNAKASQAGQTALMLAVSHGRGDMVRALLSCGAQVNVRDDDGSTALMCACEHGHVDIVRQLLSVPGCDASLTDNDGSTALSIALEASQNDIAVLLYAHLNFAKPPSPQVSPKSPLLGSSPP